MIEAEDDYNMVVIMLILPLHGHHCTLIWVRAQLEKWSFKTISGMDVGDMLLHSRVLVPFHSCRLHLSKVVGMPG